MDWYPLYHTRKYNKETQLEFTFFNVKREICKCVGLTISMSPDLKSHFIECNPFVEVFINDIMFWHFPINTCRYLEIDGVKHDRILERKLPIPVLLSKEEIVKVRISEIEEKELEDGYICVILDCYVREEVLNEEVK